MRLQPNSIYHWLLSPIVILTLLLGHSLSAAAYQDVKPASQHTWTRASELTQARALEYLATPTKEPSKSAKATPTPEPTATPETTDSQSGGTDTNTNSDKAVEDKGDTEQSADGAPAADAANTEDLAVTSLDDARLAVVQIVGQGTFADPAEGIQANAVGAGSGFIIDPSGIAVTNNHVVTGAAFLKVYVAGEEQPRSARVLGVSECSDLAVIDIKGDGYHYLEWSKKPLKVGLKVYAAGFPLGDPEYTLTDGIIAKAKAGGDTPWASVEHVLQQSAVINPGNSGGPLLDADGHVLGINYASLQDANQYFAIANDVAAPIIETLREGQDVDSLGINGQAIQVDEKLSGIWVASVASGSVADKAGLKPGDFITSIENVSLATQGTMAEYCDILRSHEPEDTLNIQAMRLGTKEMMEGQLNGRTMSAVSSLGDVAGEENGGSSNNAEDYDKYVSIQDKNGLMSMEVPAAWEDVREGDWKSDDKPIGYRLVASTDVDAFFKGWDVSGVSMSISAEMAKTSDAEELADSIDYTKDCKGGKERKEITEGAYLGYIDLWKGCGKNKSNSVVVAVSPESKAYLLLIELTEVTAMDGKASEHILNSFAINEDVLNTTSNTQAELDPADYTEITDDSGLLTVSVPKDWTDTNGGGWTSDNKTIGYAVAAAPNLDDYYNSWNKPGMFFGASANMAKEMDYRGLLEKQDFSKDCTYDQRIKYDDGTYAGAYDIWTDCGGKGNRFVVLAANPKDDTSVLILINLALPAGSSDEPLQAILSTFKVTGRVEIQESGATATVQSATLNVRSGPGTNFGRIAAVNKGDALTVVGQVNNCSWLKVTTSDGKEGWVSGAAAYVSLDTACSDIPQAEAPAGPSGGNSGGAAGGSSPQANKGCYNFQNNVGQELTITFTKADGSWNKTFKAPKGGAHLECFDPGKYTYTLSAPGFESGNNEITINKGDYYNFPINVQN